MNNFLYVDKEFRGAIGGDKNRSRYIYEGLQEMYNTNLCIIGSENPAFQKDGALVLTPLRRSSPLLPDAIMCFDKSEQKRFGDFIAAKEISTLFFRTIALTGLALYAKKRFPNLRIIIDADLILSRLMDQAWKKNPSLGSRYYLIQRFKLENYESQLYKKDITFLFSNADEVKQLQEKFPQGSIAYLPNTTDVKPEAPSVGEEGTILFYGAMDSTANAEGYQYIHDTLYPLISETLEKNNYVIEVVGKGCETLPQSRYERIQIAGRVDSIEAAILGSAFVLLPIFIASGTNTRVIETAMSGRAIITTPLGIEGLIDQNNESFVASNVVQMAEIVTNHINNRGLRLENAQRLQTQIVDSFSQDRFKENLKSIATQKITRSYTLLHVPRRFTKNSWGGTETVILNIAKKLTDLGYNSQIYTSKALDNRSFDKIDEIAIRRFDYFYPFFALDGVQRRAFDAVGGNLFSFSLLFALLRNKKIDIIHLHTMKRVGGIIRSVAKWKKIPYVVTLHGGYFDRDSNEVSHRTEQLKNKLEWGKLLGWLFGSRNVLKDASAIITLSEEEYKKAHAVYGDRVCFLPNGVDTERFSSGHKGAFKSAYGIKPEQKIILCSGRIDTQKNQLLLLKTFQRICEMRDDLQLVLLGAVSDDLYLEKLQEFIRQNRLEHRVTFVHDLTPQDQLLVDAYKDAEMLVLPSRHEPFGMVILEAWSAGIPVAASATGGVTKIVSHGKNGLLFENGDGEELYANIVSILDTDGLKQKLVDEASDEVANYDWNKIVGDLDCLYRGVLPKAA